MRLPIQVLVYPARFRDNSWEFLLLHRVPRSGQGAFWQGVTGGVEEGEDVETAAWRELREETGFVPSRLERLDFTYTYPVGPEWRSLYRPDVPEIVEHTFLARVPPDAEPTTDPYEHDAWDWYRFDQAMSMLLWPENREALRRATRRLKRL